MKFKKNYLLNALYVCSTALFILISIELLLYYTSNPSQTAKIYPRYDFQEEIGIIPKKNTTIKHSARGFDTKKYSINEQSYRGDLVPLDENSKKIIVLGDSHSFGVGVNDHETFSYKLDKLLDDYRVMNVSSPGWGLTHQINRYMTIGEIHNPEVIIIQFCSNDPSDNLREKSIVWDEAKSEFVKIKIQKSDYNSIKNLLTNVPFVFDFLSGNSLIYQRSKQIFARYIIRDTKKIAQDFIDSDQIELSLQRNYISLLDKFITKLVDENKKVIFIDVASQLKNFNQEIYSFVLNQDNKKRINYLDVSKWVNESYYEKYDLGPGFTHYWGNYSNRWIAIKLAEHITNNYDLQEFDWFESIKKLDMIDKCDELTC